MVALIIVIFVGLWIWSVVDSYKDEEAVATKEVEKKENDEYNKMFNSIFFGQIKKEVNKINEGLIKNYSYIRTIYVYRDSIYAIYNHEDWGKTIIKYSDWGYKDLTEKQCIHLARAIGTIEGYTYKVRIEGGGKIGKTYIYNGVLSNREFWEKKVEVIRSNKKRTEQEGLKKIY